jgi:phosphatidylinositol alpha-mannosyltransferase
VAEAVNGADVVHVHEPLVPLVGWALLRSTGIPTVGTFHADPSRLIRAVYRRLGPVMARLVKNLVGATAVSEVAASAVRPFHPDLAVVPNALDISQYRLDVERTPHRVAFLGRDEPRKGLDVLLAAWPAIRAAVPDAELDVVGAMRAEKIPGVRFLGRVENPEKRHVLASASVFVAPNLGGESFGITLLEGMAAGCAVIASDLPAFTAVGGNGAIYFPKGSAEALAESVARVLLDPTIRQAMSQAGGLRAEVFDWTTVLPAYIEMYEAARRDR